MVRSVSGYALGAQFARASRAERLSGSVGAMAPLEDRLDLLRLIDVASALLRQGELSGAGQVLAEARARIPGSGRRWGAGWALRGVLTRDTQAVTMDPAMELAPPSVPTSGERSSIRSDRALDTVQTLISIRALGGFELVIDGARFSSGVKPQRKPLELLKVLLLFDGEPLGAVELADKLWPDSDGDTGRNSLQVAVHRLRRLLGCEAALVMQDRKLRLDPGVSWVDAWAFERQARELAQVAVGHPEFAVRATQTLHLYRGHLFAHEPEQPWMLAPRDRLRRCWLDLVRRLGQYHELRCEWSLACRLYQRTVELDPLAEETYRRLMLCQQKAGERTEALHTYLCCREQLDAALGVKPSQETELLYQTLRNAA